MKKIEEPLIVDGKRIDGRKPEEIREIEMRVGVIKNADGSALVRFGNTMVVAAVYGPKPLLPKHLQDPEKAILRCRYGMAPFSVPERARPGPDRRSIEISKVLRLALEPAIFLEEYPRAVIEVYAEVLQADGSTRVTSINAASLALADAGVPMRDLVVGLSGGKVDGTLILDLNGKEDNNCEADIPMGFMPRGEKITLLQMDGDLTPEEVKKIIRMVIDAGKKVYEEQKKALHAKYEKEEVV
ncbi:MAG: exosome complex exonuclease Rrp41 [Candidatus Aenigmarchaeota archaeon]|nr:exosome complex exonuclease Rrp41 [Candidatus Aenigmarchaeota archaeon]